MPAKQIGQRGGGRTEVHGNHRPRRNDPEPQSDQTIWKRSLAPTALVVIDAVSTTARFLVRHAVRRRPSGTSSDSLPLPTGATDCRKIVTMQCGPDSARDRRPAKGRRSRPPAQRYASQFAGRRRDPDTDPRAPRSLTLINTISSHFFRLLVEDEQRSRFVCEDAGARGGQTLPRPQPVERALARCSPTDSGSEASRLFVLEGGLGKRARAVILGEIGRTAPDEPLVVVATADPRRGLRLPANSTPCSSRSRSSSFKARLVQYTGLAHARSREQDQRPGLRLADIRVPVLRATCTLAAGSVRRVPLASAPTVQLTCSRQLAARPSSRFLYWPHDLSRSTFPRMRLERLQAEARRRGVTDRRGRRRVDPSTPRGSPRLRDAVVHRTRLHRARQLRARRRRPPRRRLPAELNADRRHAGVLLAAADNADPDHCSCTRRIESAGPLFTTALRDRRDRLPHPSAASAPKQRQRSFAASATDEIQVELIDTDG